MDSAGSELELAAPSPFGGTGLIACAPRVPVMTPRRVADPRPLARVLVMLGTPR